MGVCPAFQSFLQMGNTQSKMLSLPSLFHNLTWSLDDCDGWVTFVGSSPILIPADGATVSIDGRHFFLLIGGGEFELEINEFQSLEAMDDDVSQPIGVWTFPPDAETLSKM